MKDTYSLKIEINKNDIKNLVIYFVMLIISILIILRDVEGINVSKYVFIFILASALLLGTKNDIYCIIAFITPLSTGISYTYISLIALAILLLKEKRKKYLAVGLICMLIICCLEFISATQGNFSIITFVRFAGVFFIAYLRMIDAEETFDNYRMLNCFLFGMIVVIISLWGQMLNYYSFSMIINMGDAGLRFGNVKESLGLVEEGMSIYYNPNKLGHICCVSSFISLLLQKYSNKKIYYAFFLLFTLQGVMTGSRTFIIAYAVGLIAFFLLRQKQNKKNSNILAILVTMMLLAVLSIKYFATYFSSIVARFSEEDILNGRGTLLSYYFQEWSESAWRMIFGSGLQNYQEKYGAINSAHNSMQEVLITWGIVGLIVVLVLFALILKEAKTKKENIKAFQYIPFFIYLLLTMAGQGFSNASGMLILMTTYSGIMLEFDKLDNHTIDGKDTNNKDII